MRALIQRVNKATVSVDDKNIGTIGKGLLIFIGIYSNDSIDDIYKICNKIINLRIFNDSDEKLNYNVSDIKGEILLISQFTLCADTQKGRRPSFIHAAPPEKGKAFYEDFMKKLRNQGVPIQSGEFGAMMKVNIQNEGPVTIVLDSKKTKL